MHMFFDSWSFQKNQKSLLYGLSKFLRPMDDFELFLAFS